MHLKGAQLCLARPQALWVVVPRIRAIADSFPVAPTMHLICLGQALPMIELFADIDHAKR